MARCRFVQPKVTRLPLSEGYYVDVKNELTAGEQHNIFATMVQKMEAGEKVQLDPRLVSVAKVVEYVVGWNFTDANGNPVALSPDAINNLDIETFNEISTAVEAHEDAIEAARANERKNLAGGSA